MTHFIAFSSFNAQSRPGDSIAGFRPGADAVSPGEITWAVFFSGVERLAAYFEASGKTRWIVHTEDCLYFLQAVLALTRLGFEIVLPASAQPALVDAIRNDSTGFAGDKEHEGVIMDCFIPLTVAKTGSFEDERRKDTAIAIRSPDTIKITLFTSGSTGEPKAIHKTLRLIELEVENLHRLWGGDIARREVFASVSHQHLYGLLFYAFLPLCAGLPIHAERIMYPESLAALNTKSAVFILSPAFMKRISEIETPRFASKPVVFSSGGTLLPELGVFAEAFFGNPVREIYGSTETGGIAYRAASGWAVFEGIEIRIDTEDRIWVRSPYLAENDFVATGDIGKRNSDGSLALLGRADSIVKIEEKRVSLVEVERRLRELPEVADVHVLAIDQGRQFLAAVIVLSAEADFPSKLATNNYFKKALSRWFEAVLLPRKWRYLDELPRNEQGKLKRQELLALFEREPENVTAGSEGTGGAGPGSFEPLVKTQRVEPNKVALGVVFQLDSPYFDGHFPAFKILPAVAQIDWVMRFAQRYFGTEMKLSSLPRIKFMKPIQPELDIELVIEHFPEKKQLQFSFSGSGGSPAYSSGKIVLEPSVE